jgi:hypothetical protein
VFTRFSAPFGQAGARRARIDAIVFALLRLALFMLIIVLILV